ncbi:MAG: hypothetical protein K2J06_03195 [Muribaculaceae bacterium]|nr:hypothetical protein [Muribaculaceae bacterium]
MAKSKLDIAVEDLQKQLSALSPKEMARTLRRAVGVAARKTARQVADQAIGAGLKVDRKEFARTLKKGHSRKALRRGAIGGYVSDSFRFRKSGSGFYESKRNGPKPIPRWANRGTIDRDHKKDHRTTGRMKKYDFMSNADTLAAEAIRDIGKAFERAVARIYRKANS